jgi:ankyrin repeat protein
MKSSLFSGGASTPKLTSLRTLVESNDLAGVRRALDAWPELINLREGHGDESILHHACASRCSVKIIAEFLERGANPNAPGFMGKTPLILFIQSKRRRSEIPFIRTLIGRGADINKRSDNGLDAVDWACALGRSDVIRFLIRSKIVPNKAFRVPGNLGWTPEQYAQTTGVASVIDVEDLVIERTESLLGPGTVLLADKGLCIRNAQRMMQDVDREKALADFQRCIDLIEAQVSIDHNSTRHIESAQAFLNELIAERQRINNSPTNP